MSAEASLAHSASRTLGRRNRRILGTRQRAVAARGNVPLGVFREPRGRISSRGVHRAWSISMSVATALLLGSAPGPRETGRSAVAAAEAGGANDVASLPAVRSVYRAGAGGYHTYRIPALLLTQRGTLLAFCEGRKDNARDHGDIDLLLRRSFDGGRTWTDQQIVYEEGGSAKITIGNPCPVQDVRTGTIWLPFCRDNDRVFVTHSDDDGRTWARPREITADVKEPGWGWFATGPGHGIQLTRGRHAGRLVIPCDCRVGPGRDQWNRFGHSLVIYSDDHGKTWKRGKLTAESMNECQVVELIDARLLLSMRNYRGKQRRAFAYSSDGGISWSEPFHHPQVYCPTCQAGLHRYRWEPTSVLLYSGPAGPDRNNVSLRISENEGRTWPRSIQLYRGPSAYSDIAVLDDGDVVVLFECGRRSPYESISLVRVPAARIVPVRSSTQPAR